MSSQSPFTVGPTTPQTLKGAGTVTGNVTIAPGSSLGVDYVGGETNKLAVSGVLMIGGATVDFDDIGVAGLNLGPHVFATYGSLSGTFGSVLDLPVGYAINYNYLGNQIALVAGLAGDFNADGRVDAADYVRWRSI